MSNIIIYEVKDIENDLKLKEYLKGTAKFSSRLTREAAREGRIKVNNKVARLSCILKEGDKIEIELNREESQNIEPQEMNIDVAYEDADIIVVNKSPGMVVHPTKCYQLGTLANGLLYYFQQTGQNCIVRLVSRLDMDTSGLIIVAKNQFSHMSLARDMQGDDFEKSYLAVVHNGMPEKKGTIDAPILRPTEDSIKRAVHPEGQRSVTHYEVVKNFKEGQLVKLTLETGRTHQIRVHVSNLGCPIYGDSLYGFEGDEGFINRQALHAYRLAFPHPRTGEIIEIETDLPDDMKQLISKLEE